MIAGDDVIPLEEEEEEHEEKSMDDVHHHHLEPFPPSVPNRVSSTASSPELFSRAYSKKTGVLGDADADAGPAAVAVYPSPSGDFVACFWIHRRYVIIYHCSSGIEADQGPCLLFGWVGRDDSYLLKTPGRVTAAAAGHEKASKRASVRDLFVVSSSKDKEKTGMLHTSSPELVLRRCFVGPTSNSDDDDDESRRLVVHTSNLQIAASAASSSSSSVVKSTSASLFQSSSVYELLQQYHFTADSVINIIGGSLVNVTSYGSSNNITINSINTSSQAAAAAAHKRSGDSTTVVDSSSSQPPPHHHHHRATTSRFYALVSNKWLRTRLRVEASLALSRDQERQQARRGRRGSSVVTSSTTTTTKTPVVMVVDELSDCGIHGDDSDLQFLAVGPSIPYHPEMIR